MSILEQVIETEVQTIVVLIKDASQRGQKSITVHMAGEVAAAFVRFGFKVSFHDNGKVTVDWS